jgi:hypothetical protein
MSTDQVRVLPMRGRSLPGPCFPTGGAIVTQGSLESRRSFPTYVGELVGLGGATDAGRLVATICLVVVLVALLVRTWRGADWIASAGWATLALMVAVAWLVPWYIVWLIPLAALALSPRLELAALAMTAFMVVIATV